MATAKPATPAERQLRSLIANNTRLLGPEHRDTLSSRNDLAAALCEQGKHAEAENELRAVLEIQERVVGAEHVDTFRNRGDLAAELADQGKHAEAEKVNRTILGIQERVFGYENPFVFVTCEDLATSLEAQGKLKEAYEYIQRAETGLVKLLGPDKPPSQKIKAVRKRIEAKLKK